MKNLNLIAYELRRDVVCMVYEAGSGHLGGALGLAEIFSVLYFDAMKINPKNPEWKMRDYLILSNGHVCPILYASLAKRGYFPKKEINTLRKIGMRLQGHPHKNSIPGVENTSGPLGQGISQAVGLALALKRDKENNKVYCIVGDGELEEGQVWEALLFAGKEKLDNLCIIVDRNNIQIDGGTEEVSLLEPLSKKFTSFGAGVININGNNVPQIRKAIEECWNIKNKFKVVIAKNVPGRGVSFMENNYLWHGRGIKEEEYKIALSEIDEKIFYLRGGD